jgi:predicted enzyme related to lactoylglutathione lyase
MPSKKKAARKASKKRSAPKARPSRKPAPRKAAARKPAARRAAARRPAAPPAPPPPPNAIGLVNLHLDFTTHDLDAVKRFYTSLLGFSRFELDTSMNYLFIQTSPMSSLGFMPPMEGQTVVTPARESNLYFMVKDVDRAYAELSARGVAFEGPPSDMPWGHRVAHTRDPEGRRVSLAQVLAGR